MEVVAHKQFNVGPSNVVLYTNEKATINNGVFPSLVVGQYNLQAQYATHEFI